MDTTTTTRHAGRIATGNLTLANASVVKVSSTRTVTVICGGTSTSTNFIIDVVGYYL